MSRLSTNIFLIFIILRVEKSSCDKSTDIHIYPYNIKHRIENVLWTVLSIDPWERCSNTEPYTHIRRHLHSVSLIFFFIFTRSWERERERSSLLSRIDRVSHSNSSVSSSPNLGGTNGNLAFCGSKSRSLNFLRSQTSIFPPLFRKSDASRGRSFEGIDKHWTRYTGCPKINARFEL